jgi:hypothetical protein
MMGAYVPNGIQSPQPRLINQICDAIPARQLLLDNRFAAAVQGEEVSERHDLTGDPDAQIIVMGTVLRPEMGDKFLAAVAVLIP